MATLNGKEINPTLLNQLEESNYFGQGEATEYVRNEWAQLAEKEENDIDDERAEELLEEAIETVNELNLGKRWYIADLGNSTEGPCGVVIRVLAYSPESACERFKTEASDEFQDHDGDWGADGASWITRAYINMEHVTPDLFELEFPEEDEDEG